MDVVSSSSCSSRHSAATPIQSSRTESNMHLQTHMPTPASRETMNASRSKRKQIVCAEHSLSTDGCCVILIMLQQTLRSNIHAIFELRISTHLQTNMPTHAHRTERHAKRSCTNTYGKHNCMRTRCLYSIQMPTRANVEQNTKSNRNQPGAHKNSTHAIQKLREAHNTTDCAGLWHAHHNTKNRKKASHDLS